MGGDFFLGGRWVASRVERASKGLWLSLYLENRNDVLICRCIKNFCFTFSKIFSNQTKVVNGNNESI